MPDMWLPWKHRAGERKLIVYVLMLVCLWRHLPVCQTDQSWLIWQLRKDRGWRCCMVQIVGSTPPTWTQWNSLTSMCHSMWVLSEAAVIYLPGRPKKPGPLCFTACNFRNIDKICIKFGTNQSKQVWRINCSLVILADFCRNFSTNVSAC